MTRKDLAFRVSFCAAALVLALCGQAAAQGRSASLSNSATDKAAPSNTVSDDQYFKNIYRDFYDKYKLGPADQIAIRVVGQPDYSLEKVEVSPVGRVYHPLVGDVEVAGLTVDQLTQRLTVAFSQYIIDPKVSVSLLGAQSAMVGVLGDISRPGIVVMSRPMNVLDVITAAGGVADTGSKSNVTVLRQHGGGRLVTMKVNVKRIMEGKAGPEENIAIQAGDTIIVHGNFRKKLGTFTSLVGFGRFMDFIIPR